jgi:hypothetical protein
MQETATDAEEAISSKRGQEVEQPTKATARDEVARKARSAERYGNGGSSAQER